MSTDISTSRGAAMIIDAHQHVWDLQRAPYPWLGPQHPQWNRTFTFEELRPHLRRNKVSATVMVQSADNDADTDYMRWVADRHPEVVGIVAYLPLDRPDVAASRLAELRNDPRVVGIRTLIHEQPDPDWILRAEVRESLALVEEAGLAFDYVAVEPRHLEHVPELSARHPRLRLVIDHLAKPPVGGSDREPWWSLIAAAAENPLVHAKVSGLYPGADTPARGAEEIQPVVDRALEVFGAARLMYGGDWPISVAAGGYDRVFQGLEKVLSTLGKQEASDVWGGTAARCYRIPEASLQRASEASSADGPETKTRDEPRPAPRSTMLTAAYVGDRTMQVDEATATPPGPGEVQIEVEYVGICGTDLHILHGAMDARVALPAIIGHEMSGKVAALGTGVGGLSVGDPVTVMPLVWDGTCAACRAGHQHVCHNLDFVGIDSPGALQSVWNVPADIVVPLPRDLALAHAALVEPVAVAVHDVRRSELTDGDKVVVLGGGPIGVLIGIVARDSGAEVVVSEPDAGRRAMAEKLGLVVVDPASQDLVEVVAAWTGGAGADVVFEVSGAPPAVLTATSLAKVRGTVVVVAIHPEPRSVDLKQVFWRELRVLGARVYERTDFEHAVELLASGVVPAAELISEVVPLDRVADAFAILGRGRAMKVLVDVQGSLR